MLPLISLSALLLSSSRHTSAFAVPTPLLTGLPSPVFPIRREFDSTIEDSLIEPTKGYASNCMWGVNSSYSTPCTVADASLTLSYLRSLGKTECVVPDFEPPTYFVVVNGGSGCQVYGRTPLGHSTSSYW